MKAIVFIMVLVLFAAAQKDIAEDQDPVDSDFKLSPLQKPELIFDPQTQTEVDPIISVNDQVEAVFDNPNQQPTETTNLQTEGKQSGNEGQTSPAESSSPADKTQDATRGEIGSQDVNQTPQKPQD